MVFSHTFSILLSFSFLLQAAEFPENIRVWEDIFCREKINSFRISKPSAIRKALV
jgi:hypothetical protein